MKTCPRCTYPLSVEVLREIELDHCRRCGGTYLCPEKGPQVLGPFVDPSTWIESGIARLTGEQMLQCPTDFQTLRVYEVGFGDEAVEIDFCSECRGVWIDEEEGKALREIVMKAGQQKETDLVTKDARSGPLGYLFQLISSFPLEVWNPIHNRPRATLGLLAVLGLTFLVQWADGSGAFTAALELVPAEVLSGRRLWTIFTAIFLHGNLSETTWRTISEGRDSCCSICSRVWRALCSRPPSKRNPRSPIWAHPARSRACWAPTW
jgi:Zn-finger nucleic acid-binding protein